MSALEAVEELRQRRLTRNRRNAGLGFRYGDAFTSPAEEAALRLAQAEADRALVEAELVKADNDAARDEKLRAEIPPLLDAATARYVKARTAVEVALYGRTFNVTKGTEKVEIIGLLDGLRELADARREYESVWASADKLGVVAERIPNIAIAHELHTLMNLAANA